ncbi:Zn2 Cys6 DNA-binding [Fusarium albosuccineum]|uniref:Zn2 Cys6 DNA-binding n=1 Tax=Fusarium albosuccineum TaxID=1237068 RepID=A0A8H4LQ46_9HYPO|nr:Zn2 Cys6 DNA-binding [Fusarium albosuccineum]
MEPSRKRLRRSTRSCYQCRKRKVKCQLTDEDVETCAECIKSGTRCTLQAPDTGQANGHSEKEGHESRLERIETLLKKLVDAHELSRPDPTLLGTEFPVSFWNDLLAPQVDNVPIPTIDDQRIILSSPPDTPDVKQSLVDILPSPQDAVTIVNHTTAWLWGMDDPPGNVLKPKETPQFFDISAVSRGSTMGIAKTLLYLALYMQQLPSSFELQLSNSQDIEQTIQLYVQRAKMFLVSLEDEACPFDTLECLQLLGMIQINDGAVRQAWMTFRRAVDIARVNGFQNSFSISARQSPCTDTALRRRIWLCISGDCYCSLLLGLEPGLGVAPFGFEDESWNDPLADDDASFQRRFCPILARISQRNVAGLEQDGDVLQEIDKALNKLQDLMPASWWRSPSIRQDRSPDSAKAYDRLMCQLWFFQARIFAHIPIAFAKPTANSTYSLASCMEASRITLQRYLGLQQTGQHQPRCRVIDLSAFLAAVVLLLARAQRRYHEAGSSTSRYDSDRDLLEQVADSFDSLGKTCSREHLARQSSGVLSVLLEVVDSDPENSWPREKNWDSDFTAPVKPLDTKSATGDILASSIKPVLEADSPASHLINLLFATARPVLDMPNFTPGELGIDELLDPTILQ